MFTTEEIGRALDAMFAKMDYLSDYAVIYCTMCRVDRGAWAFKGLHSYGGDPVCDDCYKQEGERE